MILELRMMRCDRNSRIALNCHRTNSLEPWNLFVCNSLWQLAVLHATRVFRITIFSHFIDVEVFHGEFAMNTQCCNHFPATFCLKQSRSVQVSAIMPSHKIVPFELASDPRHRELDTPVPLSSLLCPAECFYLGSPCVLKVRFGVRSRAGWVDCWRHPIWMGNVAWCNDWAPRTAYRLAEMENKMETMEIPWKYHGNTMEPNDTNCFFHVFPTPS